MALWLWTILLKGRPGRAYNVGSENAISVAETVAPSAEVRVARAPEPGRPQERYVPDTARARTELGLSQHVDLEEALKRTAAWARGAGAPR